MLVTHSSCSKRLTSDAIILIGAPPNEMLYVRELETLVRKKRTTSPLSLHCVALLAIHEQRVPDPAHEGEIRARSAERDQCVAVHQQVPEHQDLLLVHRGVVVLVRRVDDHVAEQPHGLFDVLTHVRVIPVDTRVRKVYPIHEAAARRHLGLSEPGDAVAAIIQSNAVPMHGAWPIDLIDETHGDGGVLRDPNQRTRHLSVEPVHDEIVAANRAPNEHGGEHEGIAIAEAHQGARFRRWNRMG